MIDVGGTGQQSVIAAVVCCVAMEAKQIIIRGVVRRQHTYVKCDCEEANRQRQAPSRDRVLCEGERTQSRPIHYGSGVLSEGWRIGE